MYKNASFRTGVHYCPTHPIGRWYEREGLGLASPYGLHGVHVNDGSSVAVLNPQLEAVTGPVRTVSSLSGPSCNAIIIINQPERARPGQAKRRNDE